jgi:hypothetical protein
MDFGPRTFKIQICRMLSTLPTRVWDYPPRGWQQRLKRFLQSLWVFIETNQGLRIALIGLNWILSTTAPMTSSFGVMPPAAHPWSLSQAIQDPSGILPTTRKPSILHQRRNQGAISKAPRSGKRRPKLAKCTLVSDVGCSALE